MDNNIEHKKKIKGKKLKEIFIKLIKYMREYRLKLFISLLFGVLSTIFFVVNPRVLAKITNELFKGVNNALNGMPINIDIKYMINTSVILVLLYILNNACSYIQGFMMAKVSVELTYKLRSKMFEKINRLPVKYFDEISNGEILSRITNDIDTMTSMLSFIATQVITSILTIVGIIVMMYSINWLCASISLFAIVIIYVSIQAIIKYSQKYFEDQQRLIGDTNGYVEEICSQHSIMKSFNAEKKSQDSFKNIVNKLYVYSWKSSFFSSLLIPITFIIGNFNYLVVILISCIMAVKGKITVGDIQAFIQYVKSLHNPISLIADIAGTLQRVVAASERVFEFLDIEEEKEEVNTIKLPNYIEGYVEFKNVVFGYNNSQKIIKDISFKVKKGQKVAIVGVTGSGKTTLVKLLMRFYELDSGAIYIDGINIANMSKHDLRSIFSMVLQDTWMYSGTIADNIKYGKLDATNDELLNAAKLAYVDKFVSKFSTGYNIQISYDNSILSQGERQLITIARAIIANPYILILDEATSSVDTKTEKLIQKALDNLMKGKTSFIIAHRLSTIKNADVVVVMSHGEIVEMGSHNELMSITNGHYLNMYNSQFEF